MKIRFGLQLDGQRGWHGHDSLGEITVGANGMLSILEAQLGLISDAVPQSRRVVQYLEYLKRCDHEQRFYHRSLQADELGTAATLVREWDEREYRVTVTADGMYELDGKRFKSLSAAARHITGTQWSGPKFFGLPQGRRA